MWWCCLWRGAVDANDIEYFSFPGDKMSKRTVSRSPRIVDWPLAIGLALTVVYYAIILQSAFEGSVLHRYTTQHYVEYVIVLFLFWGVVDVIFHVIGFPREF